MISVELKTGFHLKHGEYRIERVLGQGGFGITYEAEQVSLGRRVAVKEFFMKDICNRDEATSHVSVPSVGSKELVEKFREKFIREAKMIAGLDHEHIVKIYDVFEENGTAYYVMEYLGGGSLGDGVKAGKALPELETVGYIRQVADALSYLHSQNILHFDVKPSNILLGRNGSVKLIDFGISKHYDESGVQTSSTPVGISKGYAPLEQYQQGSDLKSFTPATDIYSLGATLYALLSGSNPPEASVVYEDGLPIIADVSQNVMQTIGKAMQPRRKDRPQSVAEFLKLLVAPSVSVQPGVSANKEPENDGNNEDSEETVLPEAGSKVKADARDKSQDEVKDNGEDRVQAQDEETKFDKVKGHEWVDLGLSVKWATCNVGASSPEEYGNYFAWGETIPKKKYDWSNLKYCNDSRGENFSMYNQNQGGTRDNRTVLDLSDDAARANWGGSWRMPTINEFQELIDRCIWSWDKEKKGYTVVSKINGNTIFLPTAGYRGGVLCYRDGLYGYYWSSSIYESYSFGARYFSFRPGNHGTGGNGRYCGLSVRPVCP